MTRKFLKNSDTPPYIQGKVLLQDFLHHTGLYPEDVILRLCQKHGIPHAEHKEKLYMALEYAAKKYASQRYTDSLELSAAEISKQLKALSKASKTLAKQIEGLPHKTQGEFYRAQAELEEEFTGRQLPFIVAPPSRMEEVGTAVAYPRDKNREPVAKADADEVVMVYTDHNDIKRVFTQIDLICQTALGNLKPGKGGRPENRPLYGWVWTVSNFWIKDLKRAYTVDGHSGEVITEAGNFLTDCLRYLDPTAIDGLYSQMRRYRDQLSGP